MFFFYLSELIAETFSRIKCESIKERNFRKVFVERSAKAWIYKLYTVFHKMVPIETLNFDRLVTLIHNLLHPFDIVNL